MNKIRISLTEQHGEIRGTIQSEGDGVFRFEALALVIEKLAADCRVPPDELLNDLKGHLCQSKTETQKP